MCDDYVWTGKSFNLRQFVDRYWKALPRIITTVEGYAGRDDQHLISSGELLFVYDIAKQGRIIFEYAEEDQYVSVPKHLPQKIIRWKNFRPDGPPMSVDHVFDNHKEKSNVTYRFMQPMDVSFGSDKTFHMARLGELTPHDVYEQKYLMAYSILEGEVSTNQVVIPVYLPIEVDVALVGRGQSEPQFREHCLAIKQHVLTFPSEPPKFEEGVLLFDDLPEGDYDYIEPVETLREDKKRESKPPPIPPPRPSLKSKDECVEPTKIPSLPQYPVREATPKVKASPYDSHTLQQSPRQPPPPVSSSVSENRTQTPPPIVPRRQPMANTLKKPRARPPAREPPSKPPDYLPMKVPEPPMKVPEPQRKLPEPPMKVSGPPMKVPEPPLPRRNSRPLPAPPGEQGTGTSEESSPGIPFETFEKTLNHLMPDLRDRTIPEARFRKSLVLQQLLVQFSSNPDRLIGILKKEEQRPTPSKPVPPIPCQQPTLKDNNPTSWRKPVDVTSKPIGSIPPTPRHPAQAPKMSTPTGTKGPKIRFPSWRKEKLSSGNQQKTSEEKQEYENDDNPYEQINDDEPLSPEKGAPATSVKWLTPSDIPSDISNLSVAEVGRCLELLNLRGHVQGFSHESVDGSLLMGLNEQTLREHFKLSPFEAQKLYKFAQEGWRPHL